MTRFALTPLLRERRAVAAVEFAMTGGAVMVTMIAIIELGMVFLAQQSLDRGAQRAARYAVVHSQTSPAPATTQAVINQFYAATPVFSPQSGNAPQITVTYPAGNVVGQTVVVTANFTWQPVGSVGNLLAIPLSATAQDTIQY